MEAYTHRLIHDLLCQARRPVFISDERIDGDSLGAALALVDFLKMRGVRAPVYVKTPVPEKYCFLPNVAECTHDLSVFDDPTIDLVVVFDCSDAEYVAGLVARVPGAPKVIVIDHHATNPRYGHVNQVLTDSPATAEVIYRFFKENRLPIGRDAAVCLLTGICFDTTVFSNSATGERALGAASDLILCGGRTQDVVRAVYSNKTTATLRVWGAALERLRRHPTLDIVSTFITRADIDCNGISDEEVDGLSDFLNLVTDADTLFVLRETRDGGVKVSMRSQTRNVAALAKAFGGGGHVKAAGFTMPDARLSPDPAECWKKIENVIISINL